MSRSVSVRTSRVALAAGGLLLALGASPAAAIDDFVTITVTLPYPDGGQPGDSLFYRLAGQSAYYNTRTGGFTTGGALDGLTSTDSFHDITFAEVFPEPSLTDYLRFGYFGVLETVFDDGTGEQVLDRSLIVAGQFGAFEGMTISAILPFLTESELVDALVSDFDSPQFFSALFSAIGNNDLLGDQTLFLQTDPNLPTQTVRFGETLGLYAFIGGDDGSEALQVGNLSSSVLRIVPAPSAASLLVLAGALAARRRRRA